MMANNSDFQYEPPTKDFIENSLLYGLLTESDTNLKYKSFEKVTYDSQDLRSILMNKNRFEKWLIKFAFDNKRLIKKIPWLSNLALSIKRYLIRKYIRNLYTGVPRLDLSGIMNLEVNNFIWQLYLKSLGRVPDEEGLKNTRYLLCSGASKEAVAYIICTSNEFADRAQVVNIDKYKQAYRKYLIHKGLRSLPVISYIWAVAAVPRRIFRLEIDQRIRYVDSQLVESQHYEELTKEISLTKNNLEPLFSELNQLRQEIDSLFSENKLLRRSIGNLQKEIDILYKTESSQNLTIANLNAELSKFITEYSGSLDGIQASIISQNSASNDIISKVSKFIAKYPASTTMTQESLYNANQNIINCNIKLDNLAALITDVADQNKQMIYGLPGGIIAVQTKEYVIGVPSEEWRLAIFLSKYGFFELGTEKYYRSILKAGMNVLDVGAYVGIYTLHALTAGCNVYSYEPTPKIFSILSENVGINGFDPTDRAHLYNYAVADKEDHAKFSITENGVGQMNSFYAMNPDDRYIDVKTICLDDHLADLDHVDIAKIDVEGAEPLVLKGMKGIVDRNPNIKIIMEFAPRHLKRARKDPLDFIHEIHSMGLEIHLIQEETGEILAINNDSLCEVFSVNILLTKLN